jgi:hypothetical protein
MSRLNAEIMCGFQVSDFATTEELARAALVAAHWSHLHSLIIPRSSLSPAYPFLSPTSSTSTS